MVYRFESIALIVCLSLTIVLTGCWSPGFGFRKSGADGIVIDQDGYPLTNARIRASWLPACLIPFIMDTRECNVPVDSAGAWRFYKWGIERLRINAYAPEDYEPWIAANGLSLYPGHCASNVVFQFYRKKVPKESE